MLLPVLLSLCLPTGGDLVQSLEVLAPRAIGPAGMSGRVASLAGVPGDPLTVWVGAATGGLWQTTNGGLSWQARFEDQESSSIGSIALWPTDPDVIWIGTGEGNPRNSSSVGTGMYRSLDGGNTWRHLGLELSEKIHRILLDPRDRDSAWVAVLGPTWSDGEQRGVYHTSDGGESWQRQLFFDARTGCSDLAADPRNPEHMLAGMWSHRRSPDFFESGGEGSGLFATHDGGRTWRELGVDDGLPEAPMGRIGLAWSRSHPNTVYALVEAETPVLLRSDDGGNSFRTVNSKPDVAPRPFYFCDIRVDPKDPERVYSLHTIATVSTNGGADFETLIPYNLIHPDHHALWIDPTNPQRMINGNDGGIAFTHDRGKSWRFARNLPLAQYYHIAVDMAVPFNVYGGMQDNGSWQGPSAVWENGGIRNHHWTEVGFGDGFGCVPLPGSTTRGYGMSQGGSLYRWDSDTGERCAIRPDGPDDTRLRFAWNAGIAVDPFEPNALWYGSQFVHRSTDLGRTWQIISPDLTSNDPRWQRQAESGGLSRDVTAAENHCTILAIAPSDLEAGLLWVGTDDGRLWRTQDGGQEWTSLEERLEGVAPNTWISHVEAGKHSVDTAWVVLDGHRRGDRVPHLYVTHDGGENFERLALEGVVGHAHTLEEDPIDPNLLFLGTEGGLWVSSNRGAAWTKWGKGFPTVPVRSLVVHPRDHDLVIGTHGRAAWIVDDIRPLRAAGADRENGPVQVVQPPPAIAYQVKQTGESRFPGSEEFRGKNRSRGALISFRLTEPEGGFEGKGTLDILDETEAQVLMRIKFDPTPGLNRLTWNLRSHGLGVDADKTPLLERSGGPAVVPGLFHVRVRMGAGEAEAEDSQPLQVLPDPRARASLADLFQKRALLLRLGGMFAELKAAVTHLERAQADITWVRDRHTSLQVTATDPTEDAPDSELTTQLEGLEGSIKDLLDQVQEPEGQRGIHESERLFDRLGRIRWYVSSHHGAPRPAEEASLAKLTGEVSGVIDQVNQLLADKLPGIRQLAREEGLLPFGHSDK